MDNNIKTNLMRVVKKYEAGIKEILRKNSLLLLTHIRQDVLLGGTTVTKLRKRTGKLSASMRTIPVTKTKNGFEAGVSFGTKYARAHIGKLGSKFIIRAKPGKALAIPLPAALTPAGVPRGRPRDEGIFGNVFPIKTKTHKGGKLILYGQLKYQKGSMAGQMKGKLVPLFLLVKSVSIPARIDPDLLLKWIKPKIIKDLKSLRAAT